MRLGFIMIHVTGMNHGSLNRNDSWMKMANWWLQITHIEEGKNIKFTEFSSLVYKRGKFKNSLLEIIAKYGVLFREWGGLYYALLEVSKNSIVKKCPSRWLDCRKGDHC